MRKILGAIFKFDPKNYEYQFEFRDVFEFHTNVQNENIYEDCEADSSSARDDDVITIVEEDLDADWS